MGFITKFLILIVGIVAGVAAIKYREKMVRMVGKNYYAEKYLGAGGSYSLWILIGAILIVGTIIYVFR